MGKNISVKAVASGVGGTEKGQHAYRQNQESRGGNPEEVGTWGLLWTEYLSPP